LLDSINQLIEGAVLGVDSSLQVRSCVARFLMKPRSDSIVLRIARSLSKCRGPTSVSVGHGRNQNGYGLPIPLWLLSLPTSGLPCAHDLLRFLEFGDIKKAMALRRAL
jgi:hypothetical protein